MYALAFVLGRGRASIPATQNSKECIPFTHVQAPYHRTQDLFADDRENPDDWQQKCNGTGLEAPWSVASKE